MNWKPIDRQQYCRYFIFLRNWNFNVCYNCQVTKDQNMSCQFFTLCMLGKFPRLLLSSADFFKITFSEIFFQEHYQSVKQFGPRSGPTFCRSWSGSKLFAKVISRQQKALLARSGPTFCRSWSGSKVFARVALHTTNQNKTLLNVCEIIF